MAEDSLPPLDIPPGVVTVDSLLWEELRPRVHRHCFNYYPTRSIPFFAKSPQLQEWDCEIRRFRVEILELLPGEPVNAGTTRDLYAILWRRQINGHDELEVTTPGCASSTNQMLSCMLSPPPHRRTSRSLPIERMIPFLFKNLPACKCLVCQHLSQGLGARFMQQQERGFFDYFYGAV